MDNPQMSDYSEIINIQAMTAKLLQNGEVIAEYKVETCDRCSKVSQLDKFGYQKSHSQENLIWFCKECRGV
jgi:hypothetical protein